MIETSAPVAAAGTVPTHGVAEPRSEMLATATGKAARRLIPLLALGYMMASVDRSNIGFAQLQMNADLGLNPASFGLGAGLFFLTYTLFEIPSNLMLQRFGPRTLVSTHSNHMGTDLRVYGVRPGQHKLLRRAVASRGSGGGLVPGCAALHDLLVPA